MSELISIIVPIYNVEKYIHRCIDSILCQSYKNIEIILVDDESPDNCGKICEDYAKKDQRIKVIHKNNGGLGFARNSGLEKATGKFVTFIDGDDYIGVTHIEEMYKSLVSSNTDTCIAGYTKVFSNRREEHINECAGKVFFDDVKTQILPRMCGANSEGKDYIEMSVCMVLFSNEIIKKNHLRFVSEREYVSEDLVFDFEYYPLSLGVCVSNVVDYYYCDNEGSLTTKYREDRFESQIRLYNLLREKSKDLNIFKDCVTRLQNTVLAIARYSIKVEYKFQNMNGNKVTEERVKRICENETLKQIFREYDDSNIKISSRIIHYFIKKRKYTLLKIVMYIKNFFNI